MIACRIKEFKKNFNFRYFLSFVCFSPCWTEYPWWFIVPTGGTGDKSITFFFVKLEYVILNFVVDLSRYLHHRTVVDRLLINIYNKHPISAKLIIINYTSSNKKWYLSFLSMKYSNLEFSLIKIFSSLRKDC